MRSRAPHDNAALRDAAMQRHHLGLCTLSRPFARETHAASHVRAIAAAVAAVVAAEAVAADAAAAAAVAAAVVDRPVAAAAADCLAAG